MYVQEVFTKYLLLLTIKDFPRFEVYWVNGASLILVFFIDPVKNQVNYLFFPENFLKPYRPLIHLDLVFFTE